VEASTQSKGLAKDTSFNLSETIVSGQLVKVPFFIALVDSEGQVVTTDNSTTCELIQGEGAELAGSLKSTSEKGIVQFDSFTLSGAAGSSVDLKVSCSNAFLSSTIEKLSQPLFLRNCVEGEHLQNGICVLCLPGTFSLNPTEPCKRCPDGAQCLGNFTVAPEKGYWRKDSMSETFYECPRKKSCLGPEEAGFSLTGKCADEYTGVQCAGCVEGYALTGNYECKECSQDLKARSIRALMLFLSVACIIANLLVAHRLVSKKKKSQANAFLKVLLSYFQVTFMIVNLKFEWPSLFEGFIDFHIKIIESSGVAFNFDCLTDNLTSKENFFRNSILISGLPFAMISVASLCWLSLRLVKKVGNMKEKVIGSAVVLLYIVMPQVMRAMLSFFACQDIGGNYWISSDFSIKCWDSEHTRYALGLALPTLLIWIVSLPVLSFFILRHCRNRLEEEKNLLMMGYLYIGFKPSLYLWEFMIMLRKLSVISFAVFMDKYHSNQAYFTLMCLFVSFVLQIRLKPYAESALNLAEEVSISTSAVFSYSTLIISTEEANSASEVVLFAILLLSFITYSTLWLVSGISWLTNIPLLRITARILCRCCRLQAVPPSIVSVPSEDLLKSKGAVSTIFDDSRSEVYPILGPNSSFSQDASRPQLKIS